MPTTPLSIRLAKFKCIISPECGGQQQRPDVRYTTADRGWWGGRGVRQQQPCMAAGKRRAADQSRAPAQGHASPREAPPRCGAGVTSSTTLPAAAAVARHVAADSVRQGCRPNATVRRWQQPRRLTNIVTSVCSAATAQRPRRKTKPKGGPRDSNWSENAYVRACRRSPVSERRAAAISGIGGGCGLAGAAAVCRLAAPNAAQNDEATERATERR